MVNWLFPTRRELDNEMMCCRVKLNAARPRAGHLGGWELQDQFMKNFILSITITSRHFFCSLNLTKGVPRNYLIDTNDAW